MDEEELALLEAELEEELPNLEPEQKASAVMYYMNLAKKGVGYTLAGIAAFIAAADNTNAQEPVRSTKPPVPASSTIDGKEPVRVAARPKVIDLNPDMSAAEKRKRTVEWIKKLVAATPEEWDAKLDKVLGGDHLRKSKWAEHFAFGKYTKEYPGGEFGENGITFDNGTTIVIFRVRVFDPRTKDEKVSKWMVVGVNPTDVDYGDGEDIGLEANPCGVCFSNMLGRDKDVSVKWVKETMLDGYLSAGGKIVSVSGD
jgi:hypothetical protein